MHMLSTIGTVLVVVSICYAENFSFCKLSDPNIDKCLAKNIESALHLIKSGVPEYGLKPFDPLHVPKLTIDAGSGAVHLAQHYKNVELLGLADVTINKAHYDAQKKTLLIIGTFPKITQLGDYTVDGAILSLPVTGSGKASLILDNVVITVNFQFEDTQRDGQTYFKIKSIDADITPKRMRMNFENLFNGNKLLGDNINKLINDEWQALYNDVKASNERSYAEVFKNYASMFFDKVPVEKIFLQ